MIAFNYSLITSGDLRPGPLTWESSHYADFRNLAHVLPTLWSGGDIYVEYPTGGMAYVKPKFRNIRLRDIVLYNDHGRVEFTQVMTPLSETTLADVHGIVVRVDQ